MNWRIALVALATMPLGALAQDQPPPHPVHPSVRATGDAVVTANPDRATLDIGVTARAGTAQEAAAQNVRQLDTALQELRKAIGAAAEFKTAGYSVQPEYHSPQGGGPPKITGYTATNILQLTLNDVALAGKAIDVAAQSGANTINSLRFTLRDETAAQARALREAAARAREKAEAIAQALGLRVVRVLSAEEGGTNIIRPSAGMVAMARAMAAPPTPVESGTIEVRASVTVTLEVSP